MGSSYKFGEKFVYFNGLIFFGFKKCFFFATFADIILPNVLILIFDYQKYKLPALIDSPNFSSIIFLIFNLTLFFTIAFMDPGFVSRKANQSPMNVKDTQIFEYKNRNFELSYCTTCKLFRPMRTHHCRRCGICVEELDHHCPWMGNCIGRRNRALFFVFLVMMLIVAVRNIFWGANNIVSAMEATDYVFQTCVVLFVLLTMGLTTIVCFALLLVQILLISKAQTTAEYMRKYWEGVVNPFDEGCLHNWIGFWAKNRSDKNVSFEDIKYLYAEVNGSKIYDIKTDTNSSPDKHFTLEMNLQTQDKKEAFL